MARLYKRAARVTIAKPIVGSFFNAQPNAIEVEDLRVQFRVARHLRQEPNTCDVVITNLAERTRASLQTRPLLVRVDAGYDGELQRLFSGDLRWAHSRKEGADWETTLQLADGDRAYRFGRVSRSYRGGVDAATALREAATSMGLRVKLSAAASRDLQAQFSAGLSLSGVASDEVTRLLAPYGLSWSIQDGRLQVLRADEARPESPFEVSQDTGMIGSPEYGAPTEAKGKPILHVRSLLRPEILPGSPILVSSRAVRGRYRVERIDHVGDTRGQDWYTEIEATAL